ncbi:proteinase-activated receptor 2 [Vanacampus margaritifer]
MVGRRFKPSTCKAPRPPTSPLLPPHKSSSSLLLFYQNKVKNNNAAMSARGGRLCVLVVVLLRCLHTCSCNTDDLRGLTGTETTDGIWLGPHAMSVLSSGLTTVFLPIVYIVVFVVGLPANAMAVWVFLFRTKKKHPSSIYMANLALADLLFVIWVPLKIAYHFNNNDWTYGEGLCKVLVGFFYGNMYCSMAFIACISVQRYWVVVDPLAQRRRENTIAYVVSAAIWATVWLLTVPLYLYDQQVRVANLDILTCHDVTRPSQKKMAAGYFLTMGTAGFVGPAVVCAVSYALMLRELRTSMATDAAVAKKRRKAVVLIVTVLVMFMLCFAPSNVMLLAHYALLLKEAPDNLYGFYITTLCLASLNSCIDPFVYYYISDDFRQHVKNTFLCRSQRTVERMRVSFSALKFSKKSNTYTSDSGGNTSSSQC